MLYNFRISDGSDSVALLKHSEGRGGIRIVEFVWLWNLCGCGICVVVEFVW